jgi:hypothetical protein
MTINTKTICSALLVSFALSAGACAIHDADTDNGAALALSLDTEAAAVSSYEVDVTITGEFAFLSDEAAVLDLSVNGNIVHSQDIDVTTSMTSTINATLPLSKAGPNEVVATLRYYGEELSERASVDLQLPAPTLAFPSWTTAHEQSGTLSVSAPAEWSIEEVALSVDDGEFLPLEDMGEGVFLANLKDLDIGDSTLTARVITNNGGHTQEHLFHDTVEGVVAVFDCSAMSSMQPTTQLIGNNNYEIRTMRGYFGDPDGGHTITFMVGFVNDNGDAYENPARIMTYGRNSMDVELDVNRFRCNDPCQDDYDLSLYVDGQLFCEQTNYSTIVEY